MQVTGLTARAKLSQTFSNKSDEWQEDIYVITLLETITEADLSM